MGATGPEPFTFTAASTPGSESAPGSKSVPGSGSVPGSESASVRVPDAVADAVNQAPTRGRLQEIGRYGRDGGEDMRTEEIKTQRERERERERER